MRAVAARAPAEPAGIETVIGGETCWLDASGALVVPERRLLCVADLHLEKGSAFARRGAFLPPYDTGATLAALAAAIARHDPMQVVALGDSFHDRWGPERLGPAEAATLARLMAGRDWVWILGNHDPAIPAALGGRAVAEFAIGPLTFRHQPQVGAVAGEVAGHLHPVAKVVLHGRGVRSRAFLADASRCILPAFGAYAGGLNACDPAFGPLFPRGFTAHVIGRSRMFAIGRAALCGE